MKEFVSGRPYWWQWFTILSLDATSVGITWQVLFARLAGITLTFAEVFVLGASIWCAYTADRWIEGWRLDPTEILTQRHLFAARWRWSLFSLGFVLLIADIVIALRWLPAREFRAGLLLLGPVLLYLLSHQFLHRDNPWRLPKEICVALLMMGGSTVFVAARPGGNSAALWFLAADFGLLSFVNCVLIALWEREVDVQHGQESIARRLGAAARVGQALPWLLAVQSGATAAFLARSNWSVGYACVSFSSVLLGVVDWAERRMGRQLARVLADVVLLTPVLVWIPWLLR